MAGKIFRIALIGLTFVLSFSAEGATDYPWAYCCGSARPYPVPAHTASYPDSLTPVMINHVGRHGARFPASPKQCNILLSALKSAQAQKTLTPAGMRLLKLTQKVIARVNGRWGALDSLGMAEQRGIASRMMAAYPELFRESTVNAISSYAPRCIMSMDEFTHQLARMDNKVELNMASGRRFSPLVRFFDSSPLYLEFRKDQSLKSMLDDFIARTCPYSQLPRILGEEFDYASAKADRRDVALAEYAVLSGLSAMSMKAEITDFLTPREQNALWSISNMRHYLEHSASVLNDIPAKIAAPLLQDLIATTDGFIAGDKAVAKVMLRFGHAETLMPLLALMRLPGCFYLTNYPETVAEHWKDFDIVPMAANLQMILFRAPSGAYYVRIDLNEVPVTLIDGSSTLYLPWTRAREYLRECLL